MMDMVESFLVIKPPPQGGGGVCPGTLKPLPYSRQCLADFTKSLPRLLFLKLSHSCVFNGNHTLYSGTYPYSFYMRVPTPPPLPPLEI